MARFSIPLSNLPASAITGTAVIEQQLDDHVDATTSVHGIADTSELATKEYADSSASAAVTALIDSAPEALNTLNELSAALNDDANFSSTITNSLSEKLDISSASATYLTQTDAATLYETVGSASAVASDLTDHENSTTNVHGILDTADLATKAYADNSASAAAAALVDAAPSTLNTLNELAAALGDDPNFATTTASALGTKAPLDSPAFTGTPTAPTAGSGTNTTQIATTQFVRSEISNVPTIPSQTGNAGKYLTTNGTSASWGDVTLTGSIPLWTYVSGVPITATTTNPNPQNVTWRTSYFNRQLGIREWELQLTVDKTLGGTSGFGDYLFSLPAGMPDFNTSIAYQVSYTGDVSASSSVFNRVILPTSYGSAYHNGTISTTVNACIWDARRFRVIIHNPGFAIRAWGSGWYPLDGDLTVMLNLRYQGL